MNNRLIARSDSEDRRTPLGGALFYRRLRRSGPVVDSAVFRDLSGRTRLAELRQERCRQIRSEVLEVDSRPSDWMGDVQIQNLALGCLEDLDESGLTYAVASD